MNELKKLGYALYIAALEACLNTLFAVSKRLIFLVQRLKEEQAALE